MSYQAELAFLRETFHKCRIHTDLMDPHIVVEDRPDINFYSIVSDTGVQERSLADLFPAMEPATIYKLSDAFNCRYMFCLLPDAPQEEQMLLIGPYMTEEPTARQLMEWGEAHDVAPLPQKLLQTYYAGVPLLPDTSHLFAMLDTFGERVWGEGGFTVTDINQDTFLFSSMPTTRKFATDPEQAILNMQLMEQRYAYENELINAVTKGQIHKADLMLSNFTSLSFEHRLADPVRSLKNYCIIMNTLLRKAAENGGVHPVHLDSISSAFAVRIEQLMSTDAVMKLMTEMFRSYCRLVRKHSMKAYSSPVQKAILCIDADLSASHSLSTLAAMQNVSPSYLSNLFHKETGQTLTEYINEKRIRHAKHLLESTRLQVQTIAQHCGVMDVQYFTRIFKKSTGMTPKQYRASLKT